MNFINSIDENLNKLDRFMHLKIQNTFIDNFIYELQDYLEKYRSYELFKKLPQNTYLHLTGYSNSFLECMAYNEKKIYYVPKDNILGKIPELGDALKIVSPNNLTIDYSSIPLWEHRISEFKDECVIAK